MAPRPGPTRKQTADSNAHVTLPLPKHGWMLTRMHKALCTHAEFHAGLHCARCKAAAALRCTRCVYAEPSPPAPSPQERVVLRQQHQRGGGDVRQVLQAVGGLVVLLPRREAERVRHAALLLNVLRPRNTKARMCADAFVRTGPTVVKVQADTILQCGMSVPPESMTGQASGTQAEQREHRGRAGKGRIWAREHREDSRRKVCAGGQ